MSLISRACVTGLALAAASPAMAQYASPQPALPTGDDGRFQKRMLEWQGKAPAADDRPSEITTIESRPLGRPLHFAPRVSSGFGMRDHPLGFGMRMHAGVDLPGAAGSQVLATGGGVVTFAGWAGGYGNMVEVDHGRGLRTRYGHLMRLTVRQGETVAMGGLVGLMGSTGNSTGNHLHYEVRLAGRPVNPLAARYGAVTLATAIAPYLPPEIKVEPRWKGWSGATGRGQLPVAAFP